LPVDNFEFLLFLKMGKLLIIREAAKAANIRNRLSVEAKVSERVQYLEENGMKVYYPNEEEMSQFQEVGQPEYVNWIEEKIDASYVEKALESAEKANMEAK
jgi:TRAP-type C4-dicarboxylate transport system substrate-binding protein